MSTMYRQSLTRLLHHSTLRFFLVGMTAFGIDYIVLLALYYGLGLNLELATAIGFIVGFVVSFTANRQWVFGNSRQKKKLHRQIAEYIILLIFNFLFTVWSVNFLNNQGIIPVAGKLIVMTLIMCWNYALFRWVIFVYEEEPIS